MTQHWKDGVTAEREVLKSFLGLFVFFDPQEKIENEEFKQWATQYALSEGVYLPVYHVTSRMKKLGHSLKPSDGSYYYRGMKLLREQEIAYTPASSPSSSPMSSPSSSPSNLHIIEIWIPTNSWYPGKLTSIT